TSKGGPLEAGGRPVGSRCVFPLAARHFPGRSGVLTSVHAFATDPKRGIFILLFLGIVVGGSLVLFALKASQVGIGSRFAAVSRESMLVGNNVTLMVAAGSVMLGTPSPLLTDAL